MFPSELAAVHTFSPSPRWRELAGNMTVEALPFNYFTVNLYFKLLVIELDGTVKL